MPTSAVPTPDEIWKILKEAAALGKETAAIQKKEQQEAAASRKETDKQLDKTLRGIKELRLSQKETDKQLKETDKQLKETGKQLKETENLFTTQWGRLMESLVEGDLVPILNQWGIQIADTATNVKKRGEGDDYEYDIIAENGQEIVVVEVKTTLKVAAVKDFLVSLRKFKTRKPRYKDNTVYGAIAWLRAEEEAEVYAEKQGLFVIRATGSSASIVNQKNFQPQVFS